MTKSSRKKLICNVGDRIQTPSNKWGTVIDTAYTSIKPYKVLWDNNHSQIYSDKDFDNYKYAIHPPEPGLEDICEEEEQLWYQFGIEDIKSCSVNSTSAQVLASGSPLQHSSSEDLPLLAYAKSMNTVEESSPSDFQVSQLNETSKPWTAHTSQSKSLQHRHRVSRSQSKGKGKGQQTRETVSQHSSVRSQQSSHDSSASKMSEDSLPVLGNQDMEKELTSTIFCVTFPSAGTMLSGSWLEADTSQNLKVFPSVESECCWLDSPGALSSEKSRPAGQSKLETQLKQLEAIAVGECANPIFLEDALEIPMGWSDPLVYQSAVQLLEDNARHLVTVSTPESQQLDFKESSTSTVSSQTDDDLTPKQAGKETGKQTGSLYQYTANRTGKDGVIREYPLVEGRDRDRAEDKDWYWGISYVEKVRGKWCDRSASIPRWSLPLARRLMNSDFPVLLTIEACQLKWLWTTEMGDYLVGETKPEVCPRLAILSFKDKEVFATGSGWGKLLPTVRMSLRDKLQKAIAERKSFSYIKEIFA